MQTMQTMVHSLAIWAEFTRSGNPGVAGLVDWPAFTAENDACVGFRTCSLIAWGQAQGRASWCRLRHLLVF